LSTTFPSVLWLGPIIVFGLIVWVVTQHMKQSSEENFAGAYALILLLFVVTNKQAFDNYYYNASSAFLIAAASALQHGPVVFWRRDSIASS
jgi:hypothetical protein